jgi:aminopeptidase N/puromycin-sensitive aminopeptidase
MKSFQRTHLLLSIFVACIGLVGANAQRLPTNARPDHYALSISPDIANATFSGTETIDLTLAAPSKTITLNALELKIQSVTAGKQTATVSFDETKEQATFTFAKELPAGKVSLAIAYTGILNDKLRGFYLSKTKARNYAVTQFESTDARRAFPCFDEPALKATFDVSLTVDQTDTVISNTNMIADTPAGTGKHTQVFATTPKMSTYLVAFLVGDFQCTTGSSDGVPIRACSTPDKVELTPFAVHAAEHFLHYYDNYFGIKYPMPKLDLIGIPDFEAGAMENFGAITYRETEMLVDEKDGSIGEKKRVATVVAHEMAHQWFGDMVTMQWWDNLWLNEGFATWMENKAASEWHPEWHFEQDVADSLNETLNYDAVRTTRTIRASADTPAQIAEMFDGIAYGKAGAVIDMIEHWVGPQLFEQGVHNYLAAHLYANATAEDFWNAQTATSKLPVDKVMSSFVDRPGVPLVTFADKQASGFPVAQKRFYLDEPDTKVKDGAGWTIPVCVKTAGAPQCELVSAETGTLKATSGLPFFFANAEERGYYRVAYSPEQVKAITAAAEASLSVTERMGYLGDRWALTRAGQGSVGDYLDLALALKQDSNAEVLDTTLSTIAQIRNRIATDADRDRLNAVVRAQYGPVYAALGKEEDNESYDKQQIRSELYGALGEAEDPTVIAHARQVADDLFNGRKVNETNVMESVALAAESGNQAFYDRIQLVSQKTTDPELQEESLKMLTQFHDPALAVRTLEYAVSGQVRNQDSWILLAIELSERETRDIAWPWVQKNWDKVKAQFTTASGANVVSATASFCSAERRGEVAAFFATHKVEAADRALAKALDSIDACVKLRATQEPKLNQWLAAHAPPPTASTQAAN